MPRRALALSAIACAIALRVAGTAGAQGQDAGIARVEIRWERPPAGTLDRGALGVPAWTVIGVGSIAVIASITGLIASIRRARRRR